MKDRPTSAPDKQKTPASVEIVPPHILRDKRSTIQRIINRRAYELFERHGRVPGHQTEDWVQAETELLYPCCVDLKESAEAIILRVDLPGSFTVDQLRVSVETRQVMIDGERKINVTCGHADKTHTTHAETRTQRVFRVYDLSTDVDSSRATAILLGSTAEIRLPKMFTASERATATSSVALL